jgi:C-terminal processing protease CtpA/Prc
MKTFLAACFAVCLPAVAFAQASLPTDAPPRPPPFQPIVPEEHAGLGRIGVRLGFDKVTGLPFIAGLIRGGPAVDYGLRVGDVIIKIDKNLTASLTPDECSLALHGQPGTGVELTIMHDDETHYTVLAVERRVLHADQEELIHPPISEVAKQD